MLIILKTSGERPGMEQFASIMPWYDNALIIYGTKPGVEMNQLKGISFFSTR
jgi:hypothetical protein